MTRIGGALVVLLLTSFVPAPAYAQAVAAAPAPQLTVEQMKDFLKNAKVIRSRTTSKGITAPKRVTLERRRDYARRGVPGRRRAPDGGEPERRRPPGQDRAELRRLLPIQPGRLRPRRAARPRLHDAGARRAALVGRGRIDQLVRRVADGRKRSAQEEDPAAEPDRLEQPDVPDARVLGAGARHRSQPDQRADHAGVEGDHDRLHAAASGCSRS